MKGLYHYTTRVENCIFCKIVKKELPAKIEFEDDEILAIHDINAKAPIHILIMPKKHIQNLSKVEESDLNLIGKINLTAAKIASNLGIPDQFKLTTNNGDLAGQVVMHLHYHLLGGWSTKEEVVSELKQ